MKIRLFILSLIATISFNTWAETNTPSQAVESWYTALYIDKDRSQWIELHSEKLTTKYRKYYDQDLFDVLARELKDINLSVVKEEIKGDQAKVQVHLTGKILKGSGEWKDRDKQVYYELVNEEGNWKMVGLTKSYKWDRWKKK